MKNVIRNYVTNFKFYNKTNTSGHILAFIAGVIDLVWVLMVAAVLIAGGTVSFGWWLALPVTFTALAVAHYIARPIVSEYYNSQATA